MICSPVTTCARSAIHINRHSGTHFSGVVSGGPSNFCYYSFRSGHLKTKSTGLGVSVSDRASGPWSISFQLQRGGRFPSRLPRRKGNSESVSVNQSLNGGESRLGQLEVSFWSPGAAMKFLVPKQGIVPEVKCRMRNLSRSSGFAYTGLIVSLLVCYSSSQPAYAEAPNDKDGKNDEHDCSSGKLHNGKRVYTDYSIIGIPGDGRCLFRSVAHGVCLRSGRPPPSESVQRELADELRARVADEFIKRREETEWFVEGDFDTYVSQIRKPHVWGGEPELFMASHVLRIKVGFWREKNVNIIARILPRNAAIYLDESSVSFLLMPETVHAHAFTIAEVDHKMPITVYMHDEKAGGLISIAEYGQEYGKEDPIRVIYHGFGHYEALLIHKTKAPKPKL